MVSLGTVLHAGRSRSEMMQEQLSEATVLDLEGVAHPLGSLWQGGPAVITFLRHYG